MTTVINLNILNIFGHNSDKSGVAGKRLQDGHPERRQNVVQGKDVVIDVTPFSRIAAEDDINDKRDLRLPYRRFRSPDSFSAYAAVNKTYDRKGNAIPCFSPKGLHIDSFA